MIIILIRHSKTSIASIRIFKYSVKKGCCIIDAQSMKRRLWVSLFEEKESIPDMSIKEFCATRNVSEKSY